MMVTALAFALVAANPAPATGAVALAENPNQVSEPGAASLARGDSDAALRQLTAAHGEQPKDPAILINLGIAHAQRGDENAAREMFRAAMSSDTVIELETADGAVTDSRRLARKAMAMLERGEFRSAAARTALRE